ncbi:Zinc finger, ZZ type [Aphelenchoides fujianensis]|nr:Zinc finger, ZZ type [Aphelenchoides fujianensis]
MDPLVESPVGRPHAPDSPNSSSDKENAAAAHSNGPTRSQRVCDIVREFDKIAGQCETFCHHSAGREQDRRSAEFPEQLQPQKQFNRFGFRNASLHVAPSNYSVPPRPTDQERQLRSSFRTANSTAFRSGVAAAKSGSLSDLAAHPPPGRLDRVTLLESTINNAAADLKRTVDLVDPFACATHQLRLKNRHNDLQRQRATVDGQLGGKRSAIIDKRARTCLQTADRLLRDLWHRMEELRQIGEGAKRWDELAAPLSTWLNQLAVDLKRAERQPHELVVNALVGEWRKREREWLELRDLADDLMAAHPQDDQTKLRTDFGLLCQRWMAAEKTLFSLKSVFDVDQLRDDLSMALEQMDELLDEQLDALRHGQTCVDGGSARSDSTGSRFESPAIVHVDNREQRERLAKEVDELHHRLREVNAETATLRQKHDRLLEKERQLRAEQAANPQPSPTRPQHPLCASTNSIGSSSDSRSTNAYSNPSTRIQLPPDAAAMGVAELLATLRNFNRIRYSAYRAGMKLFALQKRMRLDLVELPDLDRQFRLLPPALTKLPWESLFTILRHCFENAHLRFPHSVPDVPAAIHACTEFLRHVTPGLETRVVQTILVVLCAARVDDKYRYVYRIYADETDGRATADQLKALLSDLARLPTMIEEERAFGGSTVEASVRACIRSSFPSATAFLATRPPSTLSEAQFVEWVRQDPQTLVWVRVMHRLVASEFARHNARCAACKMQPIVGIRFRCLHCFNVDLCQNCFFVQRPARGHKVSHEMHEYYVRTNAMDNVRDFTQIVHNKMRRSKSSNKIGYTPARREGRLDTPPATLRSSGDSADHYSNETSEWTGADGVDGGASNEPKRQASPEELSQIIQLLKREQLELSCAYQRKKLRERSGILTSPFAQPSVSPPPGMRPDEPADRFDEALDCLNRVLDSAKRDQ